MVVRVSALSPREVEALQAALDLAHQSWASCDQLIHEHGEVRPFTRIRAGERRRVHGFWRLFVRHGLPVPPVPRGEPIQVSDSLAEACNQGSEQERSRLRRVRQLVSLVQDEELQAALRDQIEASEARYLPAYERCGQCSNTQGGGCPDGPSRPASAPPRRCVARSHQDWLWTE